MTRPVPPTFSALEDIVKARRSVRGFLDRPIDQQTIESIFAVAQHAPSNCNVQPWIVHVVSGAVAKAMQTALHTAAASGEDIDPDVPLSPTYPAPWRVRQIDAAVRLFAAEGIARSDTDGRAHSYLRNFQFFGAPHAAFIFMPRWAGLREAADCGMYAQTLLLAMTAHGIAGCPQGTLGHYAGLVHDQLGVGDDLQLLFGVSFGYEDVDHPTSAVHTERVALADTARFHD